ncbi:hypothetical protein ACFE04_000218 [Oxalis oulophora]
MHDQESDFLQWGLSILSYDPNYSIQQQHSDGNGMYHGQYCRGFDDDHTDYNLVENDEIIARTLQEDFSHQLTVSEEDRLREPLYEYDQDGYSNHVPISSCSSPSEGGEECSHYLEVIDEDVQDTEVGKRLNQMIPIQHIPRINGEIPSFDEATSDHERLLNRLQLYDFVELKVQGDGNCQFRALSDQLHGDPDQHKYVRRQVVNQLKSHPEIYEGYVPMEYDHYVAKMSRSGEWGDHVTLQAAADSYGVRIFVITSFKDTCYIEILPQNQQKKKVIFLSFWAEVHYNSIYFQGDLPSPESRKKKKWWMFGN